MTYTYFTYLEKISSSNSFLLTNPYITDHLKKITNHNYKSQSESAYTLLGRILSEHFELDLNNLKIAKNKYGKPYFTNVEVFFNISHSDDAILCSVSDCEIGVDIEKIAEIKDSISGKIFTEHERSQINSPEDFYKLWTLKESFCKFCGKGLLLLKDTEFTIKPEIKLVTPSKGYNPIFETHKIDNYVVSITSADTTNNIFIIK